MAGFFGREPNPLAVANGAELHAEHEAEQARAAEQAREREAREAQERASRLEAHYVEITESGFLTFDNNPDKASEDAVEAGQVFPVESVTESGWVVRVNGFKRLVTWSTARPCEAETKNDRERSDAPADADATGPALNIPPAPTPTAEAVRCPRADDKADVEPEPTPPVKSAREGRQARESEREWHWRKRCRVMEACLDAKVKPLEMAVLLHLVELCSSRQWPNVFGPSERRAADLGITVKQDGHAIENLTGKYGLLRLKEIGHRGKCSVYEVLISLD